MLPTPTPKWKSTHEKIMRGCLRGIAMAAFITAFANFLCVMADDSVISRNQDIQLVLGSLLVMAAAIGISNLIKKQD